MALARILTLNPEDANVFARQLRQLGFDVEVVNPNEPQASPADLEIEFAICDQQQVLGRASAIAAQLQAEVVVFPGAIPHFPKPIPATEITSVSADLTEEPYSEPMAAAETHQPVVGLPDQAEMVELSEMPEVVLETAKEPAARRTSPLFSALANKLRSSLRYFNAALSSVVARLKRAGSSASSAIAAGVLEFHERMEQRIARIRAAHEQHLVERRKRHAEAMQRASVVEQERRREAELAAAAHGQELQRLQTEKERRLAEVKRLKPESREKAAALQTTRLAALPEEQQQERSTTSSREQWRGALAGAVAASFFFILGMILANLHSLTPLSRSLASGSIEEQVPFGPTTLRTPAASAKPASAVSRPQIPVAAPAQPAPVVNKPNPARTTVPGNKPSPEWHHFQRSSNAPEDTPTTDEVVVKHFGPPRRTTQTPQQQAGLKHYSDQ